MRPILLVLALLIAATAASAFPYVDGNRYDRARVFGLCDTLNIPAAGRSRTIYLVANTANVGIDSVLNAWRNTGTAPAFRRIQGMRLIPADANECAMIWTIYRDGATSNQRFTLQTYYWMEFPVEADSIVIKAVSAACVLTYCAW